MWVRAMWLGPVLAVAAGCILLAAQGVPVPRVHDEFSHLLAADTFAHGRLANPTHQLWQHFETFHVNHQPTYGSSYPPGQGLALAAGKLLGREWFGVWISVIAWSAAVPWALRVWMPLRWAAVGGVLGATMGSLGYWMTSYWGGALPALGGTLVLGAWGRLRRRKSAGNALVFAVGLVILACTRPYEGAVLGLVAGVGLLRGGIDLRRVAAPIVLVVLAAGVWMLFYFSRTTGDPVLAPYAVHVKTYHHRRLFLWQSDWPQPVYRHEVMRRLYSDIFRVDRTNLENLKAQVLPTAGYYGATLLLFPALAVPWILRARKIRWMLVAAGAVCLAVWLSAWIRPHYLAPAATAIIAVTLQGVRYFRTLRVLRRGAARFAAPALVVLWLAWRWGMGLTGFMAAPQEDWARRRAGIEQSLREQGGSHVILVRYSPAHDPNEEWVYNGADIDGSVVAWARAMSRDQDAELLRYFAGRKAWLLEADTGELRDELNPVR